MQKNVVYFITPVNGINTTSKTDELKAEFLCKAFSSVFTPEKDIVNCLMTNDNRGIVGLPFSVVILPLL